MTDTAGTQPPSDPNEATKRQEALSALQAWGEEVKQQISSALDNKLNELGQKLQNFGG